jgi:small subunit ribosomal protein S29
MVQKPKTGGGENRNERKKRTLTIKKKTVVKTGRPPAPGERKAMRKRIVLSNTNAIEVPGLKPLSAQTLADEKNVAQMVVLPGPVVDQLRTVEAFKTNQSWELFRTPSMLVREESVVLAKELMEAAEKKKTDIRVLSGAKGTGKSMLLLQQIAMAFSKGWIVVNIPEGKPTNCYISHETITNSSHSPGTYHCSDFILTCPRHHSSTILPEHLYRQVAFTNRQSQQCDSV